MIGASDGPSIVFYLLLLILPVSALIARRLPVRQVLLMGLAWMAVFVVALLLTATDLFDGLTRRFDQSSVSGEPTTLNATPDGHFVAQVSLNGVDRTMLIDTGATTTALSSQTAAAAGIEVDDNGFPAVIQTANGLVDAHRGAVERIEVGGLEMRNLPVIVSPAFGDVDVLGMNFLKRLRGWRVENNRMILEP